ncbi:MAG: hypothetical protein IPF42_07245 [Candidatus Microthrix sp.]|nr:hypothetical protein [Candidatus Microthrix sp.]
MNLTITPRHARTALVGIRGCVGVGALFAPSATGKLMGIDAEENPAAPYLARLFGVRELFMVALFALRRFRRRDRLYAAVRGGGRQR